MEQEDVRIDEFFDSKIMPYGMKLTHLPTGLMVQGNCKNESSVQRLQTTLMDQLAIFVGQAEGQDRKHKRFGEATENNILRAQVEAMAEQIAKLMAAVNMPVPQPKPAKMTFVPKKAKGWTAKRRAKQEATIAARKAGKEVKRILARKAKVADTPAGEKTEEELLAEQMRPPTDIPRALPKDHISHGSTVARVSPESQARGYKP